MADTFDAIVIGGGVIGASVLFQLTRLGCRNALFLDGTVSSLYAPNLNRSDISRPLGPLAGAMAR
jgi:uncharacterized protein YigE (DUF2233 family)